MFLFLTVVQAIVGALLVAVILMQKSEGGGLGVGGGNPAGLMSARGAADFLTRATAVLATVFVVLSIVLGALAVRESSGQKVDTSLKRDVPVAPAAPVDPLAGQANPAPAQPAPAAPVKP